MPIETVSLPRMIRQGDNFLVTTDQKNWTVFDRETLKMVGTVLTVGDRYQNDPEIPKPPVKYVLYAAEGDEKEGFEKWHRIRRTFPHCFYEDAKNVLVDNCNTYGHVVVRASGGEDGGWDEVVFSAMSSYDDSCIYVVQRHDWPEE